MSLTKSTYSMIKGAVANVLDYGAYSDGTNATATNAAFVVTELYTGGGLGNNYFFEATYQV
jgi:hypothetical protein